LLVYGNGVKQPGAHAHRTHFSDALRALTDGEYRGLAIIDFDGVVGIDDGVTIRLGAVVEDKERFLDLRGNPVEENPHQEAFWFWLARTINIAFIKALSVRVAPGQTAAVAFDVTSGQVHHTYRVEDRWQAQVQAAMQQQLPTGEPFAIAAKSRVFALYASDNRITHNWVSPIRNFGVLALIVETQSDHPQVAARDLRICCELLRLIAPNQCDAPMLITVEARPPVDTDRIGPWQLCERDTNTTQDIAHCTTPSLPQSPGQHLDDPAVREWQRLWHAKLDLALRFQRLKAQAVHRSLQDERRPFCSACLEGDCGGTRKHTLK